VRPRRRSGALCRSVVFAATRALPVPVSAQKPPAGGTWDAAMAQRGSLPAPNVAARLHQARAEGFRAPAQAVHRRGCIVTLSR